MGRIFLINFDETPENPFYLCSKCNAHIVLIKDYQFSSVTEPELIGSVFENVINVHTLRQEPDRTVGNDHRVSDVYCNQCGNILGIKIIEGLSNGEVREGDFILRLHKLKMWNGHQIVDAEEP